MTFGNRAHQRFLHEIVRAIGAPRQRPRIAPKSRYFSFDKAVELRHFVPS
jgi:hypothetical protein